VDSSYNARLNADDRTIELGYYGLVRNATSEDWKDIALTLSTARPGLGVGLPSFPSGSWTSSSAKSPRC